ncbi:Uncharacterised protein [Vibrio cholerae]|nr:Uncharacterised protein [Vibrio cholerae]CSB78744.1 Uncharacterised protein [Vibrio cholerae]
MNHIDQIWSSINSNLGVNKTCSRRKSCVSVAEATRVCKVTGVHRVLVPEHCRR